MECGDEPILEIVQSVGQCQFRKIRLVLDVDNLISVEHT